MIRLFSTLRRQLEHPLFILLAGAVLTALVMLPQTAFASQEQEKAEVEGVKNTTVNHTVFTYQGQLKDSSGPVNGAFDFQFTLYSAQTGGERLGSINIEDLALTNGLFSVQLDFGRAVLEAKEGWLEIGVRPGGSTEPYTVLFPRQKLTPTPYAIFAQHEQWSLIGVPVGFAGDRDKNTDIISLDEKKVSAADVEASLAKLADKAVTGTTPDERALPTAAMNPAACAQPVVCDSPDPNPAFSATNQNRMGTGIVGLGGVTGGYFKATGNSGIRVGAYGIGDSAGLVGESNQSADNASGVHGRNFAPAPGGWGVFGFSQNGFAGVFGTGGNSGVFGLTRNGNASGVFGRNDSSGWGVFGFSERGFAGVFGSGGQNGVYGQTNNGSASGVFGRNDSSGWGVFGFSERGFAGVFGSGGQNGVYGQTNNGSASGVFGRNDGGGYGVAGYTARGYAGVFGTGGQNGVYGQASSAPFSGVYGRNEGNGQGVTGSSVNGDGVLGETNNASRVGGFFRNNAGGLALRVDGIASAQVVQITGGGDVAEPFEIVADDGIRPGMVVSIDPENPGKLVVTNKAYDHRVAGIISGAGGIRPGLIMKQEGTVADGAHPVALSGRAYCWADASNGQIEPGDLLTTSATPGHAMKVTDHAKAQGAILGKAMTGLKEGKGLVLVLVTLQ